MSDITVANNIYNQLGGGKFSVMTGAKQFVYDNNSLRFTIGRNASKANRVKIELNGKDLYNVTFTKYTPYKFTVRKNGTFSERKESFETVAEYTDIYCDMLQSIFTKVTGMYTHL